MVDCKIVAIIGITILMSIALVMGHDGLLLTSAIAVIAGLGGYQIALSRLNVENENNGKEEK